MLTTLRKLAPPSTPFALLLVGLCGALLYRATLQVPWYLDDFPVLVDYPGASQLTISFEQFFARRGPALVSFALNYRFGGLDPWGYHLVNLALHLLSAALVYLLLLRVVPTRRGLALLGALLFVAHPLQTQTVNYVVQRMTGLAGLLLLTALYLFGRLLEARPQDDRPWTGRHCALYGGALVAGALAVLTKENTAVLPLLLFLYDRLLLRSGRSRRRLLWLVAPFAVVPLWLGSTALLPLLQGTAARTITSLNTLSHSNASTPLTYLFTEFSVLWLYLRLLVLPVGQALDYSYPVVKSLAEPRTLLALAGLLLLAGLAWRVRQRRPLLSFAVAWFFLTLAVESSVLPLDPVFEHRLYLPLFGFCVALLDVAARLPGRAGALLLAGLLCLYVPLTWQRNALWTDKVAFLQDNLQRVPHSERILNNLAIHQIESGRPDLAVPLLRRSLELNPERKIDYGNLALLYIDLHDYRAAVEIAQSGLRRFPDDERLWSALGQALVRSGQSESGLGYLRQAVAINPHYALGLAELGRALTRLGRYQEGEQWLRRALQQAAGDALLHYELGMALGQLGRVAEARGELQRAVELEPRQTVFLLGYGRFALQLGDTATADAMLTRLQQLDPAAAATLRNAWPPRR